MMRMVLPILFSLCPLPALAWEAGRIGAVCTLTSQSGDMALTHDPAGPVFSITVTRGEPWPEAALFGIAFLGGDALTITTDRHIRSDDGLSITVTDRGFGNVLAGMARNATATAFAGQVSLTVSLAGAAPEVAIFAACEAPPTA
ncbi:hypothetical protein [uncultured Roseicyclus sp.]|jgi:hypothetical protein|uniref:hypothetical protein n=1 Tax=uncultured Roseicyclus sp. TaxID=543072 RepID=UPI00262D73AB|nr:hypothetical protein [uncultured Roseicyclus sp.]